MLSLHKMIDLPKGLFCQRNSVGLIAGFSAIIMGLAVSQSDSPLGSSFTVAIAIFLPILSMIMAVVMKGAKIQSPLLLLALLSYWFVVVIHKAPGVEGGFAIPMLINAVFLSCVSREQFLVAIRLYISFFFIQCLLGVIAYAAFVTNIGIPHELVSYYAKESINSYYINYHFSYILLDINNFGMRLCGLYNEPGYLGTFAAFILILRKFKIDLINIVIIVASFLSFSMAFFVLIAMYWFFVAITKKRKAPIIIIVVYVLITLILPNIKVDSVQFDKLIERFTLVDGHIQGNNRADEEFESLYYQTINNKTTMLLGNGYGYLSSLGVVGATTKRWIVEYGFVGFVYFFVLFFFIGFKLCKDNKKKLFLPALFYLILVFINTYQRPFLYNYDYVILLFGGIIMLVDDINKSDKMSIV